MVASVSTPEDVINLALVRMGYKTRIGSIWEGSMAAKKALDIYSQTRDELLRAGDWDFAERNVALTLLKSAPLGGYIPPIVWSSQYPALPWLYEYNYPTDCLKVRAVKSTPIFVPNFDPQPVLYSVDNDNSLTEPSKVILTNAANAILVYAGQITDPQDWESDFTEAMASALGRRLAPVLTGMDSAKLEAADESAEDQMAAGEQG
ncbi:MAG TPA: hypothetical protein PLO16_12620 [Acidocella sp.]|nr:hypothetical protein [Acidocella sp.]